MRIRARDVSGSETSAIARIFEPVTSRCTSRTGAEPRSNTPPPLPSAATILKKKEYSMIVDERMITYIHSLEMPDSPIIEQIEQEALETYVPIIRKETQSFLKVLLMIQKPLRILEVGTAIGFSAILMSEYMPENGKITTIEKYEKRIPIARENFKRAGKEEQITLIEGDALEVMKSLEGPYDLIFMDAAKGQYIHYMPEAIRLLSEGGVLVSDNVLQDGDIIESRFAVERRNRTIHSRMREYLYELKHNDQLQTSILPLGDGVALSVKSEKKYEKK